MEIHLSNLMWHMRLAYYMMCLAEDEKHKSAHVSAYAMLRAFEEIIDAYGSMEGIHFHTLYPQKAWKERIKWMKSNKSKINFIDEWNDLVLLYALISQKKIHSGKHLEMMMTKVMNRIEQFKYLF